MEPRVLALPSLRFLSGYAPSRLELLVGVVALGREILTIFETTGA